MFHENIDDYLEMCEELGVKPEKEYKGTFNVRVSPEVHKRAVLEAESKGISLNQFVSKAIENELEGRPDPIKETMTLVMPLEAIRNYQPISKMHNYSEVQFENGRELAI